MPLLTHSMRSIKTSTILTKQNDSKQPLRVPMHRNMETIPDANEGHEREAPTYTESRDDHTVPSLIDEDLIVAHPSMADHEIREEAIEIINISFLHE